MLLSRRLSKLPNYLRAFGALSGLRLLFSIERETPGTSQIIKRYAVPGYTDPFYLRDAVADHATFWQCVVMEQYDFRRFKHHERLFASYKAQVSQGKKPLIIDCGGNIGLATRWLSRQFAEARICVVEPDRENFELLKMNTAGLGARVSLLNGGIWDRATKLTITNPYAGSAAFRVSEVDSSSDEGLRAYTIREICELHGAESPFIVKLDIEGAQSALFRSATEWVQSTQLIILELDDWLLPWSGTSRQFFSTVSKYPFEYLFRDECIFCFRDFNA